MFTGIPPPPQHKAVSVELVRLGVLKLCIPARMLTCVTTGRYNESLPEMFLVRRAFISRDIAIKKGWLYPLWRGTGTYRRPSSAMYSTFPLIR